MATSMTEFQTRLLRLLAVGLTLIGSLGLAGLAHLFNLPHAYVALFVALICTIYLAGTLTVEYLRWQFALLKNVRVPWDELAAPRRADPTQSP